MEDLDQMIFDSLIADLRCSFAGRVKTLAEFGSDETVEAVVRCIWKCRPGSNKVFPSYQVPTNPIERFRFASKISREVQLIGVKEQIGYQTLLYPNVFDSRKVFLAFFELFPKETVRPTGKALDTVEKLKLGVADVLSHQLKNEWTAEFCRFYDLQRVGHLWYTRISENELNVWTHSNVGQTGSQEEGADKTNTEELVILPTISPKPRLLPKPQIKMYSTGTIYEKHKNHMTELQSIDEKIKAVFATLTERKQSLLKLRHEHIYVAESLAANQRLALDKTDERLLKLLDEPDINIQKLMSYLSENSVRKFVLEEKFNEAEKERLARLMELSKEKRQINKINAEKLVEIEKRIVVLEEDLDRKRRIKEKLLRDCQRMTGDESERHSGRSKYVRKILEISAMVNKQNEEIRKTTASMQLLRREINLITGSLERTFIAVCRWLEKHAETNSRMQRAYKLLVRTHEQCDFVKQCIESQGQLNRQIGEVTDKIGVEIQKSVDEQLEKLLNDIMMIRHENNELEKKRDLSYQ